MGVRLADRSTHHLHLTDAGESIRIRAVAAVAAEAAFDPGRPGPWPLRPGHAWSALGHHTGTVLRRWQEAHPQMPLELLRIDDRIAGLAQGRVDAVLLRGPFGIPGVCSTVLFHESRLAAVPAHSDLAERGELPLADLADRTLVLNSVSGSTSPRLWPDALRPTATMEVGNTDDWPAAIAVGRGVGVGTTATVDVHPYPGVAYRPSPTPPHCRWPWPGPIPPATPRSRNSPPSSATSPPPVPRAEGLWHLSGGVGPVAGHRADQTPEILDLARHVRLMFLSEHDTPIDHAVAERHQHLHQRIVRMRTRAGAYGRPLACDQTWARSVESRTRAMCRDIMDSAALSSSASVPRTRSAATTTR